MNKFVKIAMTASALLIPQAATAAPPSGTFIGALQMYGGVVFICELKIDIDGSSADITVSPGDLFCGMPPNNDIAVTYSTNTVTFHGVELWAWPATCYGDLVTEWDGTSLEFDTVLPPKTSGPDCLIAGFADKA